ncbi:hypothetical protein [Mucilaginibacter pedocola]|uniref:Uncharacterized protein n=1 Tax=Mucilaginibacter pedocola TaxID=1792845 RepID=A0A1S9PGG5_9SPHI|nr:hypothetical protein [Mucilaginibacter pedocola]OOQ59997.1 hypothetical protein BC343_27080 [Mucilaginibacter pedocola]
MEAVFVKNNSYEPILPPDAAARAFLRLWPVENVQSVLWEVFALASLGGLGGRSVMDPDVLPAEDVASLFDQLIALVSALGAAQEPGGAHLLSPTGEEPHE